MVLDALVRKGNTVLIIEHNMDVIKVADWIVDMGPAGGAQGGHILFSGAPDGPRSDEYRYRRIFTGRTGTIRRNVRRRRRPEP